MTSREMLASFESQMALEAEKYLSLARVRLLQDESPTLAVVMLDLRADEIRELFQVAGLAAVRVWEDMTKPPQDTQGRS